MARNAPPKTLPPWLTEDERKAERRAIELKVSVAGLRMDVVTVLVTNISPLGCHVLGPLNASTGAFVNLAVPGFSDFAAWVAWHRGHDFGLDFAHPLPDQVVDHLLKLAAYASG